MGLKDRDAFFYVLRATDTKIEYPIEKQGKIMRPRSLYPKEWGIFKIDMLKVNTIAKQPARQNQHRVVLMRGNRRHTMLFQQILHVLFNILSIVIIYLQY